MAASPAHSDESQDSEALPHLTLNIAAAQQQNDGKITETPIEGSGKGCTLDEHKGDCKRGKELNSIEANYLKVNIDKMVDRVYRYAVQIRMDGPKKLYTKVFSTFLSEVFPKQAKQIAFDDDKMIAVSPCNLKLDKRGIHRRIEFKLPQIENVWKQSKKSKNQHLNKMWICNVQMRPASNFSLSLKRVFAG